MQLDTTVDILRQQVMDAEDRVATLRADLEKALVDKSTTLNLLRVEAKSPSPPFAVILRDCYFPSTDPGSLKGEDMLTFKGLEQRFPKHSVVLANVVASKAEGRRGGWEKLISSFLGWRGDDAEEDTDSFDAAEDVGYMKCYYGYRQRPGIVDHVMEDYETYPSVRYENMRLSVAIVKA